jgi:hypothetical protein
MKIGYQLKPEQSEVKPFVVSLSNHDRLNRPSFDKAFSPERSRRVWANG